MSSKLGTILSLIFVALFFLFGVDLIKLQYTFSELDSKSVTISYLISRNGGLDDGFINQIENTYQLDFICLSEPNPSYGDTVEYILSTEFDPMVISKDSLTISIKRTTVIGFIG